MTIIITVSVVLAVLVLIWAFSDNSNEKELERLAKEYEAALSDVNKKEALRAGRLYHAFARKNKTLTLFDEMAIANDLSTMRQEVYLIKPVADNDINEESLRSSLTDVVS